MSEKFQEISYWSDGKTEVDFVVAKKAINVTATDNIPLREWRGLEAFQEKYKQFPIVHITNSTKKNNVGLKKFLEEGA